MSQRRIVLLVDDDDDLRSFFHLVLSEHSYDVREARDGLEALQFIESYVPDVIVLDLDLPRVSGFDVLDELQATAQTSHIPVVIVTGSTHSPTNTNIRCLLLKPVTAEKLVATLEDCMGSLETGEQT